MRAFLTIPVLLLGLWLMPSVLTAQGPDARERAKEIAAVFNKSKHVVKEKHGVRVEKFKEIRSELAIRNDARDYSGTYETDFGNYLRILVQPDGRVEASGSEPMPPQRSGSFTLRNARIEGALLTGTKVYTDGATEKFEGVFINETERNSPTDPGTTTFGLGVAFDPPRTDFTDGNFFSISRLFYRLKR